MRSLPCWGRPGPIARWPLPWTRTSISMTIAMCTVPWQRALIQPGMGYTIPDARGFRFDPTARPILEASPDAAESRFPSLVGKWGIDATKPVPYREAERKDFERAWPIDWKSIKLEDFLE